MQVEHCKGWTRGAQEGGLRLHGEVPPRSLAWRPAVPTASAGPQRRANRFIPASTYLPQLLFQPLGKRLFLQPSLPTPPPPPFHYPLPMGLHEPHSPEHGNGLGCSNDSLVRVIQRRSHVRASGNPEEVQEFVWEYRGRSDVLDTSPPSGTWKASRIDAPIPQSPSVLRLRLGGQRPPMPRSLAASSSKRGPISQTRRPVQPVRARQQFARQLLTQGYTRTAHAMIAGCTAVKIPPACRILYSNWHEHYAKDAYYKHRYRAACAEPTKEGYVVQDPSSDRPFLRHQGKICVPDCIVDDVLRSVHSFAHPGLSKSRELFERRYTCHASAFGTKEGSVFFFRCGLFFFRGNIFS